MQISLHSNTWAFCRVKIVRGLGFSIYVVLEISIPHGPLEIHEFSRKHRVCKHLFLSRTAWCRNEILQISIILGIIV